MTRVRSSFKRIADIASWRPTALRRWPSPFGDRTRDYDTYLGILNRLVDERFDRLYKSEEKQSSILGIFASLAIFIACLGLFGLASFTAILRAKEMGVRKVLGASVMQIVLLFSNSYTRLILVSLIIASPITYWAMNQWLSNFAYRIDISYWPFVIAGLLTFLIAWMTVGYQSIRAATADPIRALRDE